jgi:uncharacterized protein YgiM (DUF1202 family)
MFRKGVVFFSSLFILIGVTVLPTSAQAGISWRGDFFNNTTLSAPSAFSRVDNAIAFDWGAGSPGAGVNTDNFSIRWGADPFFQAGTYRFWVLADDTVSVAIDFNNAPIISTMGQSRVGQVVSADVTLTQGTHHVQVDYQEFTGNAYVYVTWANLATNPSGPNFPIPGGSVPPPVTSGPWTAQYFANPNLIGSPSLIQTEVTPSHDWGAGSPLASIPADYFSARWTSVQYLNAGTYQLTVRADDGVRVTIDGITYINEWHTATGATFTATVNLFAGQHTFVVDYYEAGGVAFLNYTFAPTSIVATPYPTGATATVTGAYRLNVRNAPSAVTGIVLTRISRNETYGIVGRNSNTSWWQINVNGTIGWVNARYVTARNAQNVPITTGSTVTTPIPAVCSFAPQPRLNVGRLGRVTPGLPNNIRALPTSTSVRLGQIPSGGVFTVVSGPQCAEGLYWWQVNYNGVVGWTPEGGSGQYWLEPM